MIKIFSIHIQVDMENPRCKEWVNPQQYFESEVQEALEKINAIGSKFSDDEGKTKSGNSYVTVQKKRKPYASYGL